MKLSSTQIIRWSGLAAIIAGILYIAVQLVHPNHDLESITSSAWGLSHYMTLGFAFFGILGITGIYARQVEQAGWLGLIGYLLFFSALILIVAFSFLEAAVIPPLVDYSPEFVEEVYTIFAGGTGPGAIGAIYGVNGLLYLGGGILFGIATIRANVFPRIAAIVFAIGAIGSLAGAIAESYGRASTFVLSTGLIWLGISLLLQRRK